MESKTTKAVNTKAEAKTAKTETKAVKPVETKTETAKEAAGSVKASVVNAVKETKAEAVKEAEVVKAAAKEAPKKARAAKTAAKTAKATVAKKTADATAKAADKKINMFLQYAGREYNADDIVAKVKEAAAADTGKKTFKSLDIYVKPEENVAYYVVNGKPGSVRL